MKIPVIDSILGCAEELMGLVNNAEERRRNRVIRSADGLVAAINVNSLSKKASHYYQQYLIRRSRLT